VPPRPLTDLAKESHLLPTAAFLADSAAWPTPYSSVPEQCEARDTVQLGRNPILLNDARWPAKESSLPSLS